MGMKEKGLVRLTGLWQGHTDEGDYYLAGSISPSSRLLIFVNQKVREGDPDFVAYIAPPVEKDKKPRARQRSLWNDQGEETDG